MKLTLGHPVERDGTLRKLLLRPVLIRGLKQCGVVSRFSTRDETKNYSFQEALALCGARLGTDFLSANLFTESEEIQLELDPKKRDSGKWRIRRVESAPAALSHDRSKERWIDPRAPFLELLGVTDKRGKVRERMGDKFRQIERFVDLFASGFQESGLDALPEISVCDMGAGKGYLTFATYDFLQRHGRVKANVTGVESRGDLVQLCNEVAQQCAFGGLRFEKSSIDAFELPSLDVLIALHACNTATDDALSSAIRAGAKLILAAPCCHKEVRPQLVESGPLRDVLRHGIFAERHAEMATDALRALLLEKAGYRVRVTEFVAAEHTAKNVMLIASKRDGAHPPADIDDRIAALKQFYGIRKHRLEEAFGLGCAPAS